MRLLYVLRYWPTRSETFVAREIAGLVGRGHEVVVLAMGRREDGVGLDPVPGLSVLRPPRGLARVRAAPALAAVRGSHRELVDWLGGLQRPKDVAGACWAADRARRAGFDRVHAHFAGEAAEWARLIGAVCEVPWSVAVHAADLFVPRPSLEVLLDEASPAVTVCEHHARWIRERYGATARVVRMGVDPGAFGPPRSGEGPLAVVSVARWVPKKGLCTLLEALELVPEPLTLRLVSDAPPEVGGGRVRVGPLDPAEVPAELARSDVFVLPCRVAPDGDRDGVPVALIEAMAAGLPVISTPVSGIPELVDDTVGWLVPPEDPGALATALRAALDPDERARRGAAGRLRVEQRWTLERQLDALEAAWAGP